MLRCGAARGLGAKRGGSRGRSLARLVGAFGRGAGALASPPQSAAVPCTHDGSTAAPPKPTPLSNAHLPPGAKASKIMAAATGAARADALQSASAARADSGQSGQSAADDEFPAPPIGPDGKPVYDINVVMSKWRKRGDGGLNDDERWLVDTTPEAPAPAYPVQSWGWYQTTPLLSEPGVRVPHTFLATSHEWDRMSDYANNLDAFGSIFKELGPSPILRMGGASQDFLTDPPKPEIWWVQPARRAGAAGKRGRGGRGDWGLARGGAWRPWRRHLRRRQLASAAAHFRDISAAGALRSSGHFGTRALSQTFPRPTAPPSLLSTPGRHWPR
jgi:hypothetical protein